MRLTPHLIPLLVLVLASAPALAHDLVVDDQGRVQSQTNLDATAEDWAGITAVHDSHIVGWVFFDWFEQTATTWPGLNEPPRRLEKLDFDHTVANAVNAHGLVVGAGYYGDVFEFGNPTALVWEANSLRRLGEGIARDINRKGLVVGESEGRAILWTPDGARDLNDLLPADSDWVLLVATQILDSGVIRGTANHGSFELDGSNLALHRSVAASQRNLTGE